MDYFFTTYNSREVLLVQKFIIQALDIYSLVGPDEVQSYPLSKDDVSADHLLMVQLTDITLSASVPELFVD
jgi:hypothetical protein